MRFIAAAVQMECELGRLGDNLARAESLVAAACARGARLVVLPELFGTGYRLDEDYHKHAEPVPGPTTDFMTCLAVKHGVYLAGSVIEESVMRGVPYNTEVLVGPEGLVGKQSKIALYHREKLYFAPGDTAVPFETALGRIGLMICRDIRFGEIARALALKGAEIFVVSYAAGLIDIATQARAVDNTAYLIAANRVGQELDTKFCGDSRIIDPYGRVLAEAGSEEGIVTAELDTAVIGEARQRRRYLQDYRASLFLNPGFYR
ncbi:MAG: carbon-nitrogen hydrolase family protein [Bacillota bacterium]|nr:carbon-nitrogen hydrolase family protein [Bacillota bacterium]